MRTQEMTAEQVAAKLDRLPPEEAKAFAKSVTDADTRQRSCCICGAETWAPNDHPPYCRAGVALRYLKRQGVTYL